MKKLLAGFGLLMAAGCNQQPLTNEPQTALFHAAQHRVEATCKPDCYFLARAAYPSDTGTPTSITVSFVSSDEGAAREQFYRDASAFRGDWSWSPSDPSEFVPRMRVLADAWPASGDIAVDYAHPDGIHTIHLTLVTK